MSRWKRTSWSSSCSNRSRRTARRSLFSQRSGAVMAAPSGGLEDPADREAEGLPAPRLRLELLLSQRAQPVEPGSPAVLRRAPLREQEALLLQAVERGVQRALIDLEHLARALLDA